MSKNEITGDEIKSKISTKEYENNFERIFGKKNIKAGKEEALINAEACRKSPCCVVGGVSVAPDKFVQSSEEKRQDVIGQNGNVGYHEDDYARVEHDYQEK